MNNKIDIADRLYAIGDEILGISGVLSIIRECEELKGFSASHIALLQHDTPRMGTAIQDIADIICGNVKNEDGFHLLRRIDAI